MKIGVIYCCYGNPEYIDDCLKPWIETKKSHDILIAAVHGQFKEYNNFGIPDTDEDSIEKLEKSYHRKIIDNIYIQNSPWFGDKNSENIYQTEAEIRDKGLQWLLTQNCDYIWLLDNDERYTVEQINNIINYIKKEEYITWFSIPFKNYIFDGKSWVSGFCPPRIFKSWSSSVCGNIILSKCYWDNDFEYIAHNSNNEKISYKDLPTKSIPVDILKGGIKHLTWLNSNGKLKYEYQMKHFGHCGYKWNYDTNLLEFNKEYHQKHNIPIPEVFKD